MIPTFLFGLMLTSALAFPFPDQNFNSATVVRAGRNGRQRLTGFQNGQALNNGAVVRKVLRRGRGGRQLVLAAPGPAPLPFGAPLVHTGHLGVHHDVHPATHHTHLAAAAPSAFVSVRAQAPRPHQARALGPAPFVAVNAPAPQLHQARAFGPSPFVAAAPGPLIFRAPAPAPHVHHHGHPALAPAFVAPPQLIAQVAAPLPSAPAPEEPVILAIGRDVPTAPTLEYGAPSTVAPEVRAAVEGYGAPAEEVVEVRQLYGSPAEEVVEARQAYGAPAEEVVEVRQLYGSPTEEVVEVRQAYGPPAEEVVEARQAYGAPAEEVVEARQAYGAPAEEVVEARQAYGAPAEEVVEARQSYGAPAEEVVEVRQAYGSPAVEVVEARQAYGAPAEEVIEVRQAQPTYTVPRTVANVKSNTVRSKPVSIVRSHYNPPAATSVFDYSFESENGIKQEATGTMRMVDDNEVSVMKGSYSYIGADGATYAVEWYADETGFHATAPHLPKSVVPNHPEVAAAVRAQIVFAAEEDAAAAARGADNLASYNLASYN